MTIVRIVDFVHECHVDYIFHGSILFSGKVPAGCDSIRYRITGKDLTGKKVMECLHDSPLTLDLSTQPKGMYFIKAQQNGIEFNAKVVVK